MTWEVVNSWFGLKHGIPALGQVEKKVVFGLLPKQSLKWGFLEKTFLREGTQKKSKRSRDRIREIAKQVCHLWWRKALVCPTPWNTNCTRELVPPWGQEATSLKIIDCWMLGRWWVTFQLRILLDQGQFPREGGCWGALQQHLWLLGNESMSPLKRGLGWTPTAQTGAGRPIQL